MEVKDLLHMKEGDGEFSYAHNSTFQEEVSSNVTRPIMERAIKSFISKTMTKQPSSSSSLNVADLGCGIGPAPMALISLVTETVRNICIELKLKDDQIPEIQMYMSDLPTNDFNLLFTDLGKLNYYTEDLKMRRPLCFVMAAPGSFYTRLFSRNSLHLVYSNLALHWLSQVPPELYNNAGMSVNKGNITCYENCPAVVIEAYRAQFRRDFGAFLSCRSHEVVPNGYMVLSVAGAPSKQPWQLQTFKFLTEALTALVAKELIDKEMLDSFNLPYSYPCQEEIEQIVREEGSFSIEHIEKVKSNCMEEIRDIHVRASVIAKAVRAAVDTLISHHFGEIWNVLQDELERVSLQHLQKNLCVDFFTIVIMLKKKIKHSNMIECEVLQSNSS